MEGTTTRTPPIGFGKVTVEKTEELCLHPTSGATTLKLPRFKYTWRPPEGLHDQVPNGFEISLQCVVGTDEVRRFYPWNSFETFLALASAGGLAVLCQRQNLTANERHSYRAMRLLFLRVRRMNEFFRHGFDSSMDLTVAPSGRRSPDETDVLPDDAGLSLNGTGHRWSVKELIKKGKTVARAAGYSRPSMAQSIHNGLIEAARLNPLSIANEKVPNLIQSALFKVDPNDKPNNEMVEIVTDRLLVALHRHLEEPSSAFNKWFLGSRSSLIHQLAKQKKSAGGELDETTVRQVLLHLGWRSYQFTSNCIHAQLRFFQNALPETLNDREQLIFEHMNLRQPYLGNFPLVLLAPRLGFVQGLLSELWEKLPDLCLVPVFHRLLDYYSSMVVKRREVDRFIKSGRPAEFVEAMHIPKAQSQLFQEIAAEIRELENIDCGCPRREWWAELKGRLKTKKIRILHSCMACGANKETVLTYQRIIQIQQAML